MSPPPAELTNQAFHAWFQEDKAVDVPITWSAAEGIQMTLEPCEILNSTFTEPIPKLTGWAHQYNFALGVMYAGKHWIVRADFKGHAPGYKDPCTGEILGPASHLHLFDRNCPDYQKRTKFPNELQGIGNDPVALLDALLQYLSIDDQGIDPVHLPPAQTRLDP